MITSIKAPKYFSDSPDFEYTCPECGVGLLVPDKETFRSIEPPHSSKLHEVEIWDPDWINYRFTVTCVCNKIDCGEIAFVTGEGTVDQRYGEDGDPEYYNRFSIKSFFPAPHLCQIPEETPKEVANLLKKSFTLYWVDTGAAANSLRASLESLMNEMGVPANEKNSKGSTVRMSLNRRLEVWSTSHKEYANLCFALKEVGNLGSHGETVKSQHYLGSLEIYSYILGQLFENNAKRMEELAKSIREEIKGKQS